MIYALTVFHRWLALVTSLVILALAVTGSALVFEGAIDRAMNPSLWRVAPGGRTLSLDSLAPKGATSLSLPREPDRALVAQDGRSQTFIDPYTGRVLGTRLVADFNRTLPRRLHVLHVSLMGGKAGGAVVGLVTIACLVLVLTGMVLWWPDRIARVRWSASWKRVVFDLHHLLGIVAAVVLLVITASGTVIHYDALGTMVGSLGGGGRPPGAPKQPPAEAGRTPASLDSALARARQALPGAVPTAISLGDSARPYVVSMRFPEDRTPAGRSRVYVDRFDGAVLRADATRGAPLGRRLGNVMRSVHTGDVYGKPSQAIWLLASIVLASQVVTGAMMWWNGRAARASGARRRTSTSLDANTP